MNYYYTNDEKQKLKGKTEIMVRKIIVNGNYNYGVKNVFLDFLPRPTKPHNFAK